MTARSFASQYLEETRLIAGALDPERIEALAAALAEVRARGGRLFFLGVGGGAAHAAHAVNDFRKLAGFEAYAPTDNVAELTARTNDEGWGGVFVEWLKTSRLRAEDGVFVFSVGGGDVAANISPNLVAALRHAKTVGCTILGIVGRDRRFTATLATECVIVPCGKARPMKPPHTESCQSVLSHLLVSHPALQTAPAKWESVR